MADEVNATQTETTTGTPAVEATAISDPVAATGDQSSEPSTTSTTDDETSIGLSTAKTGDETSDKDETNDDKSEEKTGDADKGEAAELFGAPAEDAKYEITGLPEGMSIDEKALEAATPLFRELDLSPAGASKIAAVYAEHILPGVIEQTTAAVNEAMQTAVLDERKRMEAETRTIVKNNGMVDGEPLKTATGDAISFDGNDIKKVMQIAAKGMDRVMPAGFRDALAETGLEFDHRIMAGMYAIGKLVSEDNDMDRSTTAKPKRDADLFYS